MVCGLSGGLQVACHDGCSSRVGTCLVLPSARTVLAPHHCPGAAKRGLGVWVLEGTWPGALRAELAAAQLLFPPFQELVQTWLWDVGVPGAEVT